MVVKLEYLGTSIIAICINVTISILLKYHYIYYSYYLRIIMFN